MHNINYVMQNIQISFFSYSKIQLFGRQNKYYFIIVDKL